MTFLRSVILAASCVIASASAAPREITSLDFDWRFHRGDLTGVLYHDSSPASASSVFSPFNPAFDDSSWERVNVPHDYVFQGPLDQKANLDAGSFRLEPGWYRKTID